MTTTLLSRVVDALHAAAERRSMPATSGLRAVLDLLQAEHGDGGVSGPEDDFLRTAAVFELDALERDLLAVLLAGEADDNLAIALGLLSGTSSGRPTVSLALELAGVSSVSAVGRTALAAGSALRRWGLVELRGDGPLLRRELALPERVSAALLGDTTCSPAVAGVLTSAVLAPTANEEVLRHAVGKGVGFAWVHGAPGAASLSLAAGAFDAAGLRHVVVDLALRPRSSDLPALLTEVLREAGLRGSGLVLHGADELVELDPALLRELVDHPVPVVATGRLPWRSSWLSTTPLVVEAPPLTQDDRRRLWQDLLSPELDGVDLSRLSVLRLAPEDAHRAAATARVQAAAAEEALDVEHALAAARAQGTVGDEGLVRPPRVRPTFTDLALPEPVVGPLRDLVGWVAHRDRVIGESRVLGRGDKGRGIAALFTGSPGTGKTLAAQVVAAETGLTLLTVQLSTVVDKYIGETEKNLERVFQRAEQMDCVLFFDEADALFGSRSAVKDARDRYANQEVSYLLQRMEHFDGVTVLATNLRTNLDPAFTRRMQFILHFPDPDAGTRARLWEMHLAGVAELDEGDPVDAEHLAQRHELSGGDIRNVVLGAAYGAALEGGRLGQRHLTAALNRELRKLGRLTE